MLFFKGDIWDSGADAIVIPTNGEVKKDGTAVMGAGLARQAAEYYPPLARGLGECLKIHGNKVFFFPYTSNEVTNQPCIITFPTKEHWRQGSTIELVTRSAHELVEITTTRLGCDRVALPWVGCGLGGLNRKDVLEAIEPILQGDRYEIWDLNTGQVRYKSQYG